MARFRAPFARRERQASVSRISDRIEKTAGRAGVAGFRLGSRGAAHCHVAGSILVAAWLIERGRPLWLKLAVGVGVLVNVGLFGLMLANDDGRHQAMPPIADPYRNSRFESPVCAAAKPYLANGAVLVTDSRRLVAKCMFDLDLPIERVAVFAKTPPKDHYQLVAPLRPEEAREMVLVLPRTAERAEDFAARFAERRLLETGAVLCIATGAGRSRSSP